MDLAAVENKLYEVLRQVEYAKYFCESHHAEGNPYLEDLYQQIEELIVEVEHGD